MSKSNITSYTSHQQTGHERILRLPEVIERVGLKKSSIYCLVTSGQFPKQIKIGARSSGWLESDISQWINEKISIATSAKNQVSARGQ
jgi:prophage regulatory protein